MTWKRFRDIFTSIDKYFDRIGYVLMVIGGVVITLTIIIQVVLRYILKAPLFGLEEFSKLVVVWIYFIGAIIGTRQDMHVRGDLQFFKTARSQAIQKTIIWCLCFVASLFFLYYATHYSIWIYSKGDKLTGLWWPKITSVGSVFVGGIFITLYSIANIVKYFEAAIKLLDQKEGTEP